MTQAIVRNICEVLILSHVELSSVNNKLHAVTVEVHTDTVWSELHERHKPIVDVTDSYFTVPLKITTDSSTNFFKEYFYHFGRALVTI